MVTIVVAQTGLRPEPTGPLLALADMRSDAASYLEKAFQGLPCMSLVMSSSEKPASRMAGTNSSGTEW